jgi:hypothetical protein
VPGDGFGFEQADRRLSKGVVPCRQLRSIRLLISELSE